MYFLLGVDTKLKFTLEPSLGQNGFQQVTLFLALAMLILGSKQGALRYIFKVRILLFILICIRRYHFILFSFR